MLEINALMICIPCGKRSSRQDIQHKLKILVNLCEGIITIYLQEISQKGYIIGFVKVVLKTG